MAHSRTNSTQPLLHSISRILTNQPDHRPPSGQQELYAGIKGESNVTTNSAVSYSRDEKCLADSTRTTSPPSVDEMSSAHISSEGGVKAWMTVLGAWLVLFATVGYTYSFGVYQDFYTRFLLSSHSPSKIAWIGSLQMMMPCFLGAISGRLFDSGYFHALEISGGILFTLSLFLSSMVQNQSYYQVLLSQGLGMGVGLGLIYIPTAAVSGHHFKRRKGLATGISLSGAAIGSVIFPIVINHLIPSVGFGKTVRYSACIVLGLLVIGNCLMRTAYPAMDPAVKTMKPDIKGFFRDSPYLCTILGAILAYFGIFFPMVYLQLYAMQHGIDPYLAFYMIALLNGMGAIGRIGGNFLGDIYGPFNVFIPCTIINAGLIFAILGIKTKEALIIFSIIFGLISGASLSLYISGLATLARRPDEVGARTGISLAIASFSILGAAPSQGALLTDMFHWDKAIIFSGIMVAASAVCFICARMLLSIERQTQKV